jgi:hypothetical protein
MLFLRGQEVVRWTIEEDWLRPIGSARFSQIDFRGAFRFNVER